MTTELEYKEG